MISPFCTAYNILKKVYSEGAYLSVVLDNTIIDTDKAFVTRLVCGTTEKEVEFEYRLGLLCAKRPKLPARIIIKIGMYLIKYMNSITDYTAVNEMVKLCKDIGKKDITGFVNSTLRKFIDIKDVLPDDELEAKSIKYSIPLWLCQKYEKEYGKNCLFFSEQKHLTHIRYNNRNYSLSKLYDFCEDAHINYEKTDFGVFVSTTQLFSNLINEGKVFVQSYGSIDICKTLVEGFDSKKEYKVLDLCSAPGGKSVLLSELLPNSYILACDIYSHRTKLIEKYISISGAKNIEVFQCDGTVFNQDWIEKYDIILIDAPCSGFGVVSANPDTFIHKKEENITELTDIQQKLLENSSHYIKTGGVIVYSTCTTLKEENEFLVDNFLKNHNFLIENKGLKGYDQSGEYFFMSRMVKL